MFDVNQEFAPAGESRTYRHADGVRTVTIIAGEGEPLHTGRSHIIKKDETVTVVASTDIMLAVMTVRN